MSSPETVKVLCELTLPFTSSNDCLHTRELLGVAKVGRVWYAYMHPRRPGLNPPLYQTPLIKTK